MPFITPLRLISTKKTIKIASLHSVYSFCLIFIFHYVSTSGRGAIARKRKRKCRRKRTAFPRGGRRVSDVLRVITRPDGFLSPWKCTLSKGYSASWCATLRRETTNEAAKKGHRNGAETVANLSLLLREQV